MRAMLATGAAVATMALATAAASAKTITLHYYSKQARSTFTDAAGHPIPGRNPKAGDVFDQFNLDYAGNLKHHAKRWTASNHLRCVFNTPSRVTCDGQFAIGGSMLLATGIHPNLSANPARFTVNGGTGVFLHAHGTLAAASLPVSNNADFTIRVTY